MPYGLYNSNGQIRITISNGNTLTGRQHPDGSYYGVLTSENTTFKGNNHPSGALWVTVGGDGTRALAVDGSAYIMSGSEGYVLSYPAGIFSTQDPSSFAPYPAPSGYRWEFVTESTVRVYEDTVPVIELTTI